MLIKGRSNISAKGIDLNVLILHIFKKRQLSHGSHSNTQLCFGTTRDMLKQTDSGSLEMKSQARALQTHGKETEAWPQNR